MGRICGAVLSAILGVIAAVHGYWALGGRRGLQAVVPTVDGKRMFEVPPLATWAVVATLGVGIATTLGRMGVWGRELPRWMFRWGMRAMSAVLFVRAVGDFNVAGFTKRVTGTRFAWWDTRLYSPLCLVMAALAALTDAASDTAP